MIAFITAAIMLLHDELITDSVNVFCLNQKYKIVIGLNAHMVSYKGLRFFWPGNSFIDNTKLESLILNDKFMATYNSFEIPLPDLHFMEYVEPCS